MKKFKLETGHVIKVDDQDAYLLRSIVWYGKASSNGGLNVYRKGLDAKDHTRASLAHVLAGERGLPCVIHANGDVLDFRRSNLRACTREEAAAHTCALMRAVRFGDRAASNWRATKKA